MIVLTIGDVCAEAPTVDEIVSLVLKHIAAGGADAQKLAEIAIKTATMKFCRWYA